MAALTAGANAASQMRRAEQDGYGLIVDDQLEPRCLSNQKKRRMISQRTKDALRAAKARGVILGNAKQAEANRNDADAFAESLRPIVAPFIHLSSRRIAKVLNDRGIKSPTGKAWQSVTVLRLVERLKGESRP